jgi:diguanylate cyclase (GGDEF)-like protein/PAS domain S-box-containing protein
MKFVKWRPWIESMLEAVWVVDLDTQRILAANRAAGALQQVDPDELVGASVVQMHASPQDQFFWQDLAAGRLESIHSETLLRRSDGSTVLVERRATPIDLDDNERVCLVAMQDKSEEHRIQQQLEQLLAELRATLESSADGILVCDLYGGIRAFNRLFSTLWSLPQELLVQRDDAAVHAYLANSVPNPDQYHQRLAQINRSPLMEASDVLVLRTGRVLERVSRPQLVRGRPIGRVYAFRDITERAATETQLKLAAKVFESSLDAILVTDPEFRVLASNPAAEKLTRGPSADLLQHDALSLFFSLQQWSWEKDLTEKLKCAGYWEGELWYRRPDGSATALQASWVMLRDADGECLNTVLFVKDLTEKLAAQQRIEQLAYTDVLTGLPNRLMLTERVEHAIRLSERSEKGFGVLFLDLDRFKHINDSLGHLFGDRVLVEVAGRLKGCLRQTDTLCRLGGDEFVIHLHEADADASERTARRIIETISQPVCLEDMSFSLTCSVGIAMYPEDGTSLDELIQHADTAMYQVKERGKGHFRFYQPQMNADLLSRIRLDHAMREGLQRNEFVLHYQPRACLRSDATKGCEALVRWNAPQRGLVPPGAFIGVAEETGFIVMLGDWVMREAIRQAAVWFRQGHPCQVAVNVSALQFQQAQFVDGVAAALREHELPPELLEIEITESILILDAEEALERLQALAALGVGLSLDDFGTGYSSLSYLRRFPLQKLKIDRSFIASMHENTADDAIVSAIVQMGHALGMEVVAEGVEWVQQRDRLRELGCDQFQGFLFAPALQPTDFEKLLDAQPTRV